MIAGYSQGLVLASTEPSMTNLMHEATQNVTPFGMNPQDQQGSLMRLNGLPGVSPSPMGAGTSGNAPVSCLLPCSLFYVVFSPSSLLNLIWFAHIGVQQGEESWSR